MIKREKSCGVLVLRQQEEELYVVLLRHRFGGHWSFPKGHVEAGESERQTALREVREETGLSGIKLLDGFRAEIPYPGINNHGIRIVSDIDAVSFASACEQHALHSGM